MRLRMRWQGLGAAALLALAVTGCPKEQAGGNGAPSGGAPAGTSAGSAGGGATTGKIKIAVIPKGTQHSFWQTVKLGADAAGNEEKNVDIIWVGPQKENDITDQQEVIRNQIAAGVNALVVAATDSAAISKPLKDAMDKGIPVITIDSGVDDKSASLCYIATDNVEGGRQAADALAKLIGEQGNVGLLPFKQGSASSDEREKGFLEGIKKYPKIKVVKTLYSDSDVTKANEQTNAMLTANPDIVGIFAANEPNGVGAAQVLKVRGVAGKVKLVAYDASKEEIQALKDGIIQATVVQDPFQMGYKGVKYALKAIRKEPISEKFINSGMTVVTKDNLTSPEVDKLINPKLGK
jgi:ABC-type sugar transport system, periplasmic component